MGAIAKTEAQQEMLEARQLPTLERNLQAGGAGLRHGRQGNEIDGQLRAPIEEVASAHLQRRRAA